VTEPVSGKVREGGCLCGAVRYRLVGEPVVTFYCHCRMCQRAAGAPVVAWATVRAAALAWTGAEPRRHRSSAKAERLFCADCGTPLAAQTLAEPDLLDLAVATLDDPADAPPERHDWESSRLPWFDTTDDWPRHKEACPT
jgi:hypothetical protein